MLDVARRFYQASKNLCRNSEKDSQDYNYDCQINEKSHSILCKNCAQNSSICTGISIYSQYFFKLIVVNTKPSFGHSIFYN